MVSAGMALLFYSPVDSAPRWRSELARLAADLEVRIWPDIGDPDAIGYALVWRPPPGLLASLPKLRLILSLGAGIDHILRDPQLPKGVPIVRLVDPYLTDAMSEYVALQVLKLHRQDLHYCAQQQAEIWRELPQKNAGERPVGIFGVWRDRERGGTPACGAGFPGFRLESHAKRPRRVFDLCGGGGFGAAAQRDRDPRLPVAADTRDRRDIVQPHFRRITPRRRLDQCRPRRASRRSGSDPGPRFGAIIGRSTRCVWRGAIAAGAPILASPANHCDAACRRGHKPRDRRPDDYRQHPPLRGRPAAIELGRPRPRILISGGRRPSERKIGCESLPLAQFLSPRQMRRSSRSSS